jgi:hypothetical protein
VLPGDRDRSSSPLDTLDEVVGLEGALRGRPQTCSLCQLLGLGIGLPCRLRAPVKKRAKAGIARRAPSVRPVRPLFSRIPAEAVLTLHLTDGQPSDVLSVGIIADEPLELIVD